MLGYAGIDSNQHFDDTAKIVASELFIGPTPFLPFFDQLQKNYLKIIKHRKTKEIKRLSKGRKFLVQFT